MRGSSGIYSSIVGELSCRRTVSRLSVRVPMVVCLIYANLLSSRNVSVTHIKKVSMNPLAYRKLLCGYITSIAIIKQTRARNRYKVNNCPQ